jgi:hypothetical protein
MTIGINKELVACVVDDELYFAHEIDWETLGGTPLYACHQHSSEAVAEVCIYPMGVSNGVNMWLKTPLAVGNYELYLSPQDHREYIERLEVALKKIAAGEVRTTHKIDKCSHGAYGYENCDMCYIEFAEQALASKPKDI